MKVYIDNSRFIEFVSEITDKIVEAQFGVGFDKNEDEEGNTTYTEEAQDVFNEKYDEVESMLNTTLGVYSDNDLEDADGRN